MHVKKYQFQQSLRLHTRPILLNSNSNHSNNCANMMNKKDRQTDDPETCKSFGKGVITKK